MTVISGGIGRGGWPTPSTWENGEEEDFNVSFKFTTLGWSGVEKSETFARVLV